MRSSVQTIPALAPGDIAPLVTQEPAVRFTRTDLEYYLRRLMQAHSESTLLIFNRVALIERHCSTFARHIREGYLCVIQLADGRLLLDLLGGTTGYESFYVSAGQLADPARWDCGWTACAGTVHRWHACHVPPLGMQETYRLLSAALTTGPTIRFPRPLTQSEQQGRADLARDRFIESLRCRRSATITSTNLTTYPNPGPRPS